MRAIRFAIAVAVVYCVSALSGCWIDWGGSVPVDNPGSITVFNQTDFTDPNLSSFCYTTTCKQVQDTYLFSPLSQFGWTGQYDVDGYINGGWTTYETTSSAFIGNSTNVQYISTHGSVYGTSDGFNVATVNFRTGSLQPGWTLSQLDSNFTGTNGVTSDNIPLQWNGPNWLLLDACSAVQPNVGWELDFGGSLHGILGFNQAIFGLTTGGFSTLVDKMEHYETAWNAWVAAANASSIPYYSGLIPPQNISDVMESSSSSHFGHNGDASPTYYSCCTSTSNTMPLHPNVVAKGSSPINSQVNLIPEQMDETSWYNTYGGNSGNSTITDPSSNEHLLHSGVMTVAHFLASGGLFYSSSLTMNNAGFTQDQALSYALSWIQNNGGLPSDAVLTLAGTATAVPYKSNSGDAIDYEFMWQHGSSFVLSDDNILISIDDNGHLTRTCHYDKEQHRDICVWQAPWIPVYNVNAYRRLWRGVGTTAGSISRISYTAPANTTFDGYAYCAPPIDNAATVAIPCDVWANSQGNFTYVDPTSGAVITSGVGY